MKILLTGGTGFLGKKILESFLAKNYEVIVTTRSKLNEFQQLRVGMSSYEQCGATPEALEAVFRRHPDIDVVLHAATDYGRCALLPTSVFATNIEFPMHLLELAMKSSVRLFANIDTFFNTKSTEYEHLGEYALSKRHFQEWGEICGKRGKIRFVNLRLFHMFGPGDGGEKFIPSIVERCLSDSTINLTAGLQRRDFIFIEDAVRAINLGIAAEINLPNGYVHYDVGSGISHSIREVVELIKRLSNSNSVLNFGVLPNRVGEFVDACADVRALDKIGWSPMMSLEEGLKMTIVNQRAIKGIQENNSGS